MPTGSGNGARLPAGRVEEKFHDKKPLYTQPQAFAEANRCLYCADAPCIQACPTSIDIPTFIRKIATGNTKGAARTILDSNILGQSCAQVCPVEVLCAGNCVYPAWGREPIAIGRLQRYAVETTLEKSPDLLRARKKPATGKKVACVGAGPGSVAAAALLALEGHAVTIFEKKAIPGGLNTLGIAPYKMTGLESLEEIEWVLSRGDIQIRTGHEVNESNAAALLADFDAVFLGLGLGSDSMLGVPGEDGPSVHGATALIERLKSDPSVQHDLEGVRRAVVVGGGNTAIDIAHELALLGIDTTMVYRRTAADMSAYAHEMESGRIDGVKVITERRPLAYVRDPETHRLRAIRIADASGAYEEEIACDLVALAIGQNRATQVARAFPGVQTDGKGRVVVDPGTHRTGNAKVWSGGDCVNGGKEVVNAVAEAKIAVHDMQRALGGQ
jgi:dihydropyrimidine dehydrogenase (NAD+) subunit PreT